MAFGSPGLPDRRPKSWPLFINTLGSRGLEVIRSSTILAQKAAYFHQVLHQDFDLPGISRFVLGPYWRVASPAQQQEFPTEVRRQLLDIAERYEELADGIERPRRG
jgi:hypothetical protein